MSRKIVSIKVAVRDGQYDRWWNTQVGARFMAIDKGTTYEIIGGDFAGCLINKTFCAVEN